MPFLIGIEEPNSDKNIGTLWRSAYQLGADGIFTIRNEYIWQSTDTYKTWKQVPYFNYPDITQFLIPKDFILVGIEQNGECLKSFSHPKRTVYLLGNENKGLSDFAKARCHKIVSIPSMRQNSYNVSMAGTIVMYDRMIKHD